MAYKAIVAGASGLIGSNLVDALLASPDYEEVLVLVRKELPVQHKKLVQLVINFDDLNKHAAAITGHAAFCCLGTTKAQTPNEAEYRKIDFEYPLAMAQLAKQNGVDQLHLVSSIGADSSSPFFYTRLKGELENALQKLNFSALHIYQPSMLVGHRTKPRAFEGVLIAAFKLLNPLMIGGLRKYKSINGSTVAKAMLKKSLEADTGNFIHTSDKIQSI
ncbi:NAD(P)H-binding protein [Mucilaginibacter sp.]|uniref:NAD(P)H-binding protein n=1 Tax=Mucilaginibacter sp. TaxID=1882438 RepID=UPI0035BC121D